MTEAATPIRTDTKERKRIFGYDLLRALAILLVLIDHGTGRELTFQWKEVSRTILSPDAVLFIMLSGALLLPVKGSWSKFLAKRVKRVMPPFLFWTILWAVLLWVQGRIPGSWMVHIVKWSWLTPFYGSAWFVFIIMGLYLFMPFISPWIRQATRRQLEMFMLLWLLGGGCVWMQAWMGMNEQWNWLTMFVNYFGYCIAGVYLVRYPIDAKPEPLPERPTLLERAMAFTDRHRKAIIIASGLVVGLAMPCCLCFRQFNTVDVDTLVSNNHSFTTYLWGALIFATVIRVKSLGRFGDAIVRFISVNAYGVYLCHFVLQDIVFKYYFPDFYHTSWMIPALIISSLALSELTRHIPIIGSKD